MKIFYVLALLTLMLNINKKEHSQTKVATSKRLSVDDIPGPVLDLAEHAGFPANDVKEWISWALDFAECAQMLQPIFELAKTKAMVIKDDLQDKVKTFVDISIKEYSGAASADDTSGMPSDAEATTAFEHIADLLKELVPVAECLKRKYANKKPQIEIMSRAKVGGTVGVGGNFAMALKIQVDVFEMTKIDFSQPPASIRNAVLESITIFAEGSAAISGGAQNVVDIDPISFSLKEGYVKWTDMSRIKPSFETSVVIGTTPMTLDVNPLAWLLGGDNINGVKVPGSTEFAAEGRFKVKCVLKAALFDKERVAVIKRLGPEGIGLANMIGTQAMGRNAWVLFGDYFLALCKQREKNPKRCDKSKTFWDNFNKFLIKRKNHFDETQPKMIEFAPDNQWVTIEDLNNTLNNPSGNTTLKRLETEAKARIVANKQDIKAEQNLEDHHVEELKLRVTTFYNEGFAKVLDKLQD